MLSGTEARRAGSTAAEPRTKLMQTAPSNQALCQRSCDSSAMACSRLAAKGLQAPAAEPLLVPQLCSALRALHGHLSQAAMAPPSAGQQAVQAPLARDNEALHLKLAEAACTCTTEEQGCTGSTHARARGCERHLRCARRVEAAIALPEAGQQAVGEALLGGARWRGALGRRGRCVWRVHGRWGLPVYTAA